MEDKEVIILENVPIEFTTGIDYSHSFTDTTCRHYSIAGTLFLEINENNNLDR